MRYAHRFALLLAALSPALPAGAATITTLAGNGSAGFSDGPALSASFVFPAGVAYDQATGSIYIADAGAQRIRMLSSGGVVTTVAGSGALDGTASWVPGGYVDGQAGGARFNGPLALAIDKNQTIFVADSGNHCVRKIANGIVSTVAHFPNPTGIAVDDAGNVYVADPSVGLSKIDQSGQVSLLPYGSSPLSVAIRNGSAGPTLFVSDAKGVLIAPPGARITRYGDFRINPGSAPMPIDDRIFEGLEAVGAPFAIAPSGTNGFVYSDVRSSMVRFVDNRLGRMEPLAGRYSETTMAESAGFRDGSGEGSLLDAPMGIAVTAGGQAVVADSGNRRLRLIRDIDPRDAIVPSFGVLPSTNFTPSDFKIAYVGNSIIWFDNSWDESIQGMIESRLRNDAGLQRSQTTLKVIPVWGVSFPTDGGVDDYMRSAGSSWADMVIYQVNWGSVYYYALQHGRQPDADPVLHQPGVWREPFTAGLRKLKADLDAAHIPLLVVLQPTAEQISPIEIAMYRLHLHDFAPDDTSLGLLREAIVGSGAHWIDLSADFALALRSSAGNPLFGTEDNHLASRGREVMAAGIAAELARMQPWARR